MSTAKVVKVAVVTGANKGIGYALVKSLAETFDGDAYLTARNENLGMKALKELEEQGLRVKFHQLNTSDNESIRRFESYLRMNHGGLDILINNAGIAETATDKTLLKKQIEEVVNVNYFGTLNVCNALFPLLRPNSRVVHVSSDWGCIHYVKDENLRNKLMNKDNSIEDINSILKEYLKNVEKNDYTPVIYEGYKMSKNALNALTREQQRILDLKHADKCILVSAVHPGEVITDMNPGGNISVEAAIETILYLALLPVGQKVRIPSGQFWYEKKRYDWDDPNLNLVVFH